MSEFFISLLQHQFYWLRSRLMNDFHRDIKRDFTGAMPESLKERAKIIKELTGYSETFITIEGYGTLINKENTCDIWTAVGESLKKSAEAMHTEEAVEIYLEGLYFYLRAQAAFDGEITEYALRQRRLCKYIDDILVQTRKYNLKMVKDVLKWALFNIKIQCLFKEQECLGSNMDSKSYKYVIGEIRCLCLLYTSNSVFPFELVKIENIEAGIKQKLQSAKY